MAAITATTAIAKNLCLDNTWIPPLKQKIITGRPSPVGIAAIYSTTLDVMSNWQLSELIEDGESPNAEPRLEPDL
jgi:hypothetical protein